MNQDIIIDTEETDPEIKQAQNWLLGLDENEPTDEICLAYAVNGYERAGKPGKKSTEWVESRIPLLVSIESAETLSTQELLDLLFLFYRKDRFCSGTVGCFWNEIKNIRDVVRDRVNKQKSSSTFILELDANGVKPKYHHDIGAIVKKIEDAR